MDKQLQEWARDMSQNDKGALANLDLEALYQLRHVKICHGLLGTASRFWDPTMHVFRFGNIEICPTYEEFRGCLIFPAREGIFCPPLQETSDHEIREYFGWTKKEALPIIKLGKIDVSAMVTKYAHQQTCSRLGREYRRKAFCFCMIARYLLNTHERLYSPIIIEVIKHLQQGFDIIPTLLAETFKGLDSWAKKGGRLHTDTLNGSPYLLHIWLTEKLSLFAPLEVSVFRPVHYMKRAKNSDFYKEHNWPERLKALKVDDITWRSKWMSTPCPVLRTRGNSCVQIMGLTHSSFYVPSLLYRQLNRLPSVVGDITDVSPPKELTKDFVWSIADAWHYRDHPTPTLMTAAASTEEIASSSGL